MLFDGFQTRNNVAHRRGAGARLRREPAQHRAEHAVQRGQRLHGCHSRPPDRGAERTQPAVPDEQARAARSRFEVGEGTRTDVAQAEASRSAAVAQLAAARAQALASAATYHQIIGDEPGKLKSPSAAKGLPKSIDSAIAIADAEHPAIIATEHLVDAAGFPVKAAEGSLLPQLSASAGVVAQLPQHGRLNRLRLATTAPPIRPASAAR